MDNLRRKLPIFYPAAADDPDTPNCSVRLDRMRDVELEDGPAWVCLDCTTA